MMINRLVHSLTIAAAFIGMFVQPVLAQTCMIDGAPTGSATADCSASSSCNGKTITGCKTVTCGDDSCINAIFDSTGVADALMACTGSAACRESTITGFDTVTCQSDHACRESTITAVDTLRCSEAWCCNYSTLTDIRDSECSGFHSCTDSTFESCAILDSQMTCSGTYSCHGATLTGVDSYSCSGTYSCQSGFGTEECPSPGLLADPHLKSWKGEWFDYMGECDLNLMHAPKFDGKLDIDIQVRTTIRYDYSYIEAAALRIGKDILEVGSWGQYALNGVEGALKSHGAVPTVGGYPAYHTLVTKKKHVFDVVIGQNQNITISTMKDWVSVQVLNGDESQFGSVSGLMGTYDGKMLARDGTNLHDDIDALGQDWQVQPNEGNLFRTVRAPQYPTECRLPSNKAQVQRRLGEQLQREAAEEVCAHLFGNAFSFCVHDVMVTGDLEMAQGDAF